MEKTPLNRSVDDSPIDYDALFNSDGKQKQFAQRTVIGEVRNPKRFTVVEWIFLVVSTLSLLGVLGLNIERFVFFKNTIQNLTYNGSVVHCTKWYCTSDFILTVFLLVNLMFCFFYLYDGLFRERQFELIAFIGGVIIITFYLIINYIYNDVNDREISTLKKVRLGLVCVLGPLNVILAIICIWRMGYLVFNVIGSNKKLTTAYHIRSFIITLQYFHLEIMANIVVLTFVSNGTLISTAEKVILFLLLVYMVIVISLGNMFILWEVRIGIIVWYIMKLPFLAFYIYKLIHVAINWSNYSMEFEQYNYDGSSVWSSLELVGIVLLLAVCLGLVTVILLMTFMGFVMRNFNLKLKEKVDPPFKQCIDWCTRRFLSKSK